MKRMATMAEAYQVLLAPHNPNGPLSTLASSHVCASVPNFFRQEFMFNDVPWRDTVIDHPIADMVYDGHLHLSDRPGLGVDLVEEEMESIRVLQVILLRTFIFNAYAVSNRLNRKSGPDNRSVLRYRTGHRT